MTVETFQEIANKTLAEYTKNRREKYGWSDWWPGHTLDSQTIVFNYRATLWESDENYLIGTMLVPKTLTEEETIAHITKWLDENLAKFKS